MNDESPRFTKTEFRQIRYLLYFVVFIILFQVFQYVTTKQATKKYRELFSQVTEIFVLTNSVSFETAAIHRSVLNLSFASDSSEIKKFSNSLINAEKKTKTDIALIEQKISDYNLYSFEKTALFINLKLANEQYKKRYEKYLPLLSTGSESEKLYYRRKILRPALESLQESQNSFLLKVFSDQRKAAEGIATQADKMGFNLLIGGNVLLAIVVIILVYIILSERKKVV
ncbi:MAG: hypothetical protein V4506_15630 [Bacteroidota bacterium]